MEYLVFILAFILFVVCVFAKEAFSAKKRERQYIKSLYIDYGKLPKKEYSKDRYERISSYFRKHEEEGQLDDITWNDLNMDEIFKRMNYTLSASGEEYLYYTLRSVAVNKEKFAHQEEVIRYFQENPDDRVKLQVLMTRLGYTGKFSLYDYLDNLDLLGKRSNKKNLLTDILFIPLIILAPFHLPVALCGLTLLMCYNITSYFSQKKEIEPYIISFTYIMRLLRICDELVKVKISVCDREWELIKKHKSRLRGMRQGANFVIKGASAASTGNPLDIILDYVRMVFHIDLLLFNRMLSQLRVHVEDVDGLIGQIGYIEAAIAIGAFRQSLENGYCVPEFLEENEIKEGKVLSICEGYHPLLSKPVKNSVSTDRGVLLTGSNASGKSTFLKTVAINAIMAQTIHTCTADSYRAPLFLIYSSMSLRDDIESGESYYIVEIKALKRILQTAGKSSGRVLCFVDEVLRGTNTVERIAASTQILKSLSGSNLLCFAATHDIELTQLLEEEYDNYHFEEDIREGDIFFNYKLIGGRATSRNAIKLLQIMGYNEDIIRHATIQAERFMQKGIWEKITF